MNSHISVNESQAKKVLDSIILPPRPAIMIAISEAQQRDAELNEMAALISHDISLSAIILRTINSSFYSLPNRISSIEEAVKLLGMKNISMLITGLSMRNLSPSKKFDIFWDHCDSSGLISAYLAQQLGGINKDDAHLLGLFHDCGRILMHQQFNNYQDTLNLAVDSDQHLIYHEKERHLTDHAQVGSFLAKAWCLPINIIEAIKLHHDIEVFHKGLATDTVLSLILLIHLAEHIGNPDSIYNDSMWSTYSDEFMEYLSITEDQVTDLQWAVNEKNNSI
jgi:HD-like signal output (HDOD) protein